MTEAERPRGAGAAESLLLTPEEAAALLRVGRTTVYALIKTGELRPVHIGRSCRLSRAELTKYVGRLENPSAHESRRRPRTTADQPGLFETGPRPEGPA